MMKCQGFISSVNLITSEHLASYHMLKLKMLAVITETYKQLELNFM